MLGKGPTSGMETLLSEGSELVEERRCREEWLVLPQAGLPRGSQGPRRAFCLWMVFMTTARIHCVWIPCGWSLFLIRIHVLPGLIQKARGKEHTEGKQQIYVTLNKTKTVNNLGVKVSLSLSQHPSIESKNCQELADLPQGLAPSFAPPLTLGT